MSQKPDPRDAGNERFGFAWDNAVVFRAVDEANGYRFLGIHTPREIGTVIITPSGLLRFQRAKRVPQAKRGTR